MTDGKTKVLHGAGRGGRLVVARLRGGIDLVRGIEEICHAYGIESGVITTLFGSVDKVRLIIPEENGSKGVHEKELCFDIPTEVTSGCGLVQKSPEGEIDVHLHIVVCNVEGTYGGHLYPDTSNVMSSMQVAIQEVEGLELVLKPDDWVGHVAVFPTTK